MTNTRKGHKGRKSHTHRKSGGTQIANNFEADTRSIIQYAQQRGSDLNFSTGTNKAKLNAYKGQYRTFLTGVKNSPIGVGATAPFLPEQSGNTMVGGKSKGKGKTHKQRGGKEKENQPESALARAVRGVTGITRKASNKVRNTINAVKYTTPLVTGSLMNSVRSTASSTASGLGSALGTAYGTTVSRIQKAASATASGIQKATEAVRESVPTFSTSEEVALRKAANTFAANIADNKLSLQSQEILERETYKTLSSAMHTYLQSHMNKHPYEPVSPVAANQNGEGNANMNGYGGW